MSAPYSGGCACGAIRYEVAGAPVAENHCQCRQCQRQTGSGHGAYLTFAGATVTIEGTSKHWQTVGEMGTIKHAHFCTACGSPLYLTFPHMPDIFVIRAGSLDEPARYAPQFVFWTAAAHPWDQVDPALTRFDKMPPVQAAAE